LRFGSFRERSGLRGSKEVILEKHEYPLEDVRAKAF